MPRSPILALLALSLNLAGQNIHWSIHVLSAAAFVWFVVTMGREVEREIERQACNH